MPQPGRMKGRTLSIGNGGRLVPWGNYFFGLACRRFFTLRRGTGFAESSSPSFPSFAMYCAIKVMRRLEGELCQIFLEESPKLLQKLREAWEGLMLEAVTEIRRISRDDPTIDIPIIGARSQ